jgi:hypothetical protein
MNWRAAALFLALTACAAAVVADAGCTAYGELRLTMPRPLGDDPLALWVAVLDSRMTGACR